MRKLGKLDCLEYTDSQNVISENNNQTKTPWVILFHGFGADNQDLFSLAEVIPTNKKYNYLFPNGFLKVPIGGGFYGRAWWNIDMKALEESIMRREFRDYSDKVPEGLIQARNEAMSMIDQLIKFEGISWSDIVLGGFSQGAMLALDLYMRAPTTPKGLALLSGTAIELHELKDLTQERQGQRFFQCHGQQDLILQIKGAQKLEGFLIQHGLKGSLLTFQGGHEIPPVAINKLGNYLDNI